jgi:hypothetical protein
MARRDDREYREYLNEEQRSQRGCIARRMQPDFHHGLLNLKAVELGGIVMADHPLIGLGTAREVTVDKLG